MRKQWLLLNKSDPKIQDINKLTVLPPDIIATPAYRAAINKITTVALKAPDSCTNKSSDSSTGAATNLETVIKTSCGIEMALIERSLSRSDYRIISWSVLDREMSRNASPIEAASRLGAEIIFQINSLEKSKKS